MKYKVFDPKTNRFLEGSEDRFFLISSGALLVSDPTTEEQHDVIEELMGDNLCPQYHLVDSTNCIAENYQLRPFSGFKDIDGEELYVGDIITKIDNEIDYEIEYHSCTAVIYINDVYEPLFEYRYKTNEIGRIPFRKVNNE